MLLSLTLNAVGARIIGGEPIARVASFDEN